MGKGKEEPRRLTKVLAAIKELEAAGYRTTSDGLCALLTGSPDVPYELQSLACYGHFQSLAGKAIKGRLRTLIRAGTVIQAYDRTIDGYLLSIAEGYDQSSLPALRKKPLKAFPSPYRRIERNKK